MASVFSPNNTEVCLMPVQETQHTVILLNCVTERSPNFDYSV